MSKLKTHGRDLQNVFLFTSSIDIADAKTHLRGSVDSCLAFIKARIRTPYPVIHDFISNRHWGHSPEVKALFSVYVKAGYIEVDTPMADGSLPVEASVIKGNLAVFASLIENGADLSNVPSLASGSNNSGSNIFDFINLTQPDPAISIAFVSLAKEAIMRRQINISMDKTDSQVSLSPTPRRRMGAV